MHPSLFDLKITGIIEKRLLIPSPQGQAESDQDGHPGRGKARGGGRRIEEKVGKWSGFETNLKNILV
jgi:hypothetical protein